MASSQQLIPGLPNDLAIQCLLCLPANELVRVQRVSPPWKIAITSDRFYVERRFRAPFPSIFAIRRTRNRYECLDADVTDIANPRLLFSCDLLLGQKLFPPGVVFASVGTFILAFAPGHQVQKFSLVTRRWTPGSKIIPTRCKLLVATLGNRGILVACDNQKHHDVDDDDDDRHRHRHDYHDPQRHGHHHGGDYDKGTPRRTVCEIFDPHNQWASVEGLPDDFYVTHCFTCQDTFYVKGKPNAQSSSVYALNLTKGRWEEDTQVRDMLQYVEHDSKVITKPGAVLMATEINKGTVSFKHLRTGASDWMDVVKVDMRWPGEYFLLKVDEQIFVVVSEANSGGVSWRSRTLFYYHGLTILHIPSDELLMVDSIAG